MCPAAGWIGPALTLRAYLRSLPGAFLGLVERMIPTATIAQTLSIL